MVSSLLNRAYYIITNKDDSTLENPSIKQVLKESGCQESNISKIFKRITDNHGLSQSQRLMQATDIQEEEIRMITDLLYVEGTSEKLQCILISHKIRSFFSTKGTLREICC